MGPQHDPGTAPHPHDATPRTGRAARSSLQRRPRPAVALPTLLALTLAGAARAGEGLAPSALANDAAGAPPPALRAFAFVENLGQWDTPATHVAARGPTAVQVLEDGFVVDAQPEGSAAPVRLRFLLEGARGGVRPVGAAPLPGLRHYFLGDDPARWRSGARSFAQVVYPGAYEGVDLRLREARGLLEYDLLLAPGADPDPVVLHVEGARALSVDEQGGLLLQTAAGPLRQSPPVTWCVLPSGEQRPVECAFVVLDGERFGFRLAPHDPALPVVIDPGLEWATYLGGSDSDRAFDMELDAQGRVVVGGITDSLDFPLQGPYQASHAGGQDVFVALLDPAQAGAAQLVWATYLGGTDDDRLIRIALDAAQNVVVVGGTRSADFPTVPGAYDDTHNGGMDAFVCVLDGQGASLLASTFVGGSADDMAQAVDLDDLGRVSFGGTTHSADLPTVGAFQPSFGGSRDYFLARLDPGLGTLAYSTFLGTGDQEGLIDGTLNDRAVFGLRTLASGELVVTGFTRSPVFPTTPDAWSRTKNLGADVFLTRIDPSLGPAGLVYSTFIGGGDSDYGNSLVVEDDGVITLGGHTWSDDFPTTAGAFQKHNGGALGTHDAFVLRLDPNVLPADQLLYSTHLGGTAYDVVLDLVLDADGDVLATGLAGGDFPTTCGAYKTGSPNDDGFLVYLAPEGQRASDLRYSTLVGGVLGPTSESLTALGLASQDPPTVVAVGYTMSTDFPTVNAFQGDQGLRDAVACRLELNPHAFCHAEANSAGPDGALICGTGSTVVADNDLTLSASGLPANQFGYFLFSDATGFVPNVGGGMGNLCLSGNIVRFGKDILNSGGNGQVSFQPDLTDLPQGVVFQPGERWFFQYWYRDTPAGKTHNLSNGLAVTFH